MKIYDELNTIFQQVFGDDEIRIAPELTADDIDGWDSLSHVNLIVAIEKKFKLKFSQKELLRFRNIGDLMESISSKINND